MNDKLQAELRLVHELTTVENEKRGLEIKMSSMEQITQALNEFEVTHGNAKMISPPSSPNRGDTNRPPQPPRRLKSDAVDNVEIDNNNNLLLNDDGEDMQSNNVERLPNHQLLHLPAASLPPQPPIRHKSIEMDNDIPPQNNILPDDIMMRLVDENEMLKLRNQHLDQELIRERTRTRERFMLWTEEKVVLEKQLDTYKRDAHVISAEQIHWVQENRDTTAAFLDRVSLLWDKADESVQTLEGTMLEIMHSTSAGHSQHYRADAERLLSVQEAAVALHGQIKVSLMLIELKLRNSLAFLENDATLNDGRVIFANDLRLQLDAIQKETTDSMEEIETRTNKLIRNLNVQSIGESIRLRDMHESDVTNLHEMARRQELLEGEMTKIHISGDKSIHPSSGEMLVDQESLQLLNNEVNRVVERIKEKNESIGRLQAEIEEHKVRERTLMDELKRYMSEQADEQKKEQERIMQQNAHYRENHYFEESTDEEISEYEDKTIDGTIYEEDAVQDDEQDAI
jgi:hypothetical protein